MSFIRFVVMLVLLSSVAPLQAAPPADFTLEAVPKGKHFKLSENRGKFVALHFLLKTECPYCLRHTASYASHAKDQSDVVHVFIKPDQPQEIAKWAPKVKVEDDAPPPIYRDPNAALAKAFAIPDGYQFHGQTTHYPALVLLDPKGKEVFRYVGKNNSDRFKYEDFVKKLLELSAGK